MSGRINLDHLPRIPDKDQGITNKVEQTATILKEKLAAKEELNLYQKGWLAQYDDIWGKGELKASLFEEIITTTTTQRRALELQQAKIAPEAETARYDGQRLDRVLGVISEMQRETTKTVTKVLDEVREERGEMRSEREEHRQFVRQIFMDQRTLLEMSFQQVGSSHRAHIEAMDTLKEGIRAKGEAEAIGIAVQAQADAAQQTKHQAENSVKQGIKEKLEDTLLVGIANKMGLEVTSIPKAQNHVIAKPANPQPTAAEAK